MTTETPANGPPCSLVTVPVTVFTCAIACAVHRKSPPSTMTSFVFIARCTGCWWTERDPGARVERADDGARMCIRDGAWGPSRADGACDERALVTPVTEPRQRAILAREHSDARVLSTRPRAVGSNRWIRDAELLQIRAM